MRLPLESQNRSDPIDPSSATPHQAIVVVLRCSDAANVSKLRSVDGVQVHTFSDPCSGSIIDCFMLQTSRFW